MADISTDEYAADLDAKDPLRDLREQFIIPTRSQLKRTNLEGVGEPLKDADIKPCTYLCGNSLGLQPKLVSQYTAAYHQTWATKGVYGHFKEIEDSPLQPWLHVDDDVATDMGNIVGALPHEVAVMQTLTANLHLAMLSFYRPTTSRHKIIIESKAFPSDHYAIESQIRHHNLDPADSMITISPPSASSPTLTTEHILETISHHASSTAVLLLPAIQFYTGQFFDIPRITSHAHSLGITVGWDLAHAVGNVPLHLHSWDVDFAIWCNYKYMNCGPGAIGGLFIHEKHGKADPPLPRLAGWWGSSKASRFAMDNSFEPIQGAGGWQLSNPSVADLTAVRASLDVFKLTSMEELRRKSVRLTGYLQESLMQLLEKDGEGGDGERAFEIITPLEEESRGAQLSLRLAPGLLDGVMGMLEEKGVVVDERRPDVVRVAPAPLYNTAGDCLQFVRAFGEALKSVRGGKVGVNGGTMVEGGKDAKGWSEVK